MLFASVLQSPPVVAADSDSLFSRGAKLVKEKKYHQAIPLFQQAWDGGYRHARLHHAWGAAYYYTEQYAAAREQFQLAEKDPAFRQLAQLNLGLVAVKQGRYQAARRQFRLAFRGSSESIARLAATMLSRLGEDDTRVVRQALLLASTRLGAEGRVYDTGNDLTCGDSADQFSELNLFASVPFLQRHSAGLELSGHYYAQRKASCVETNITMLASSLGYFVDLADWSIQAGMEMSYMWLGEEAYLLTWGPELNAKRALSPKTQLRLRYRNEMIHAARPEFEYFAGSGWKMRMQLRRMANAGLVYLTYQYAQENRNDNDTGTEYFDYSPSRQTLSMRFHSNMKHRWEWEADAVYRYSAYSRAHQLLNENDGLRLDNQLSISLGLFRELNRYIKLTSRILHTANESTLPRYQYIRNELSFGLEWLTY